ncbi:hypothetical protein D3C76_1650190 [compost metagenome]
MDSPGADKVVTLIAGMVLQHRIQVGHVLEIVGVNIVAGQRGVRQDVVLERFDHQIYAFLRQNRLGLLEDFRVRHVRCADHQLGFRRGTQRGQRGQ